MVMDMSCELMPCSVLAEITSPGKVKAIVAPPKAAKDIETKPSKVN